MTDFAKKYETHILTETEDDLDSLKTLHMLLASPTTVLPSGSTRHPHHASHPQYETLRMWTEHFSHRHVIRRKEWMNDVNPRSPIFLSFRTKRITCIRSWHTHFLSYNYYDWIKTVSTKGIYVTKTHLRISLVQQIHIAWLVKHEHIEATTL